MKAILVDPWKREIREVQLDTEKSLQPIYDYLSHPEYNKVDCFCIAGNWGNRDVLYVDDTGYWKNNLPLYDIGRVDGHLIAGMGLLVGVDNFGESTDTSMSVEDLAAWVKWTDHVTKVN